MVLVALAWAGCTGGGGGRSVSPPPPDLSRGPVVANTALTEISGLAPSRRTADIVWAHNDSGDRARLFALDAHANVRGTVRIDGARAYDWEDLASFTMDGEAWLLVGDVGDNASHRADAYLYLIREPDPATLDPDRETTAPLVVRMSVVYPDGPRDCEALAVDSLTRTIFLISKRTVPAVVYTLPLTTNPVRAELTPTATRLTPLDLPQPSPIQSMMPTPSGRYGSQPTGFDIAADGSAAVVLTYANIWLYPHQAGETWAETFARRPQHRGFPDLFQAEAICFSADSQSLTFTTEGPNAPLVTWPVDLR